jgi:hypothetical protein
MLAINIDDAHINPEDNHFDQGDQNNQIRYQCECGAIIINKYIKQHKKTMCHKAMMSMINGTPFPEIPQRR